MNAAIGKASGSFLRKLGKSDKAWTPHLGEQTGSKNLRRLGKCKQFKNIQVVLKDVGGSYGTSRRPELAHYRRLSSAAIIEAERVAY